VLPFVVIPPTKEGGQTAVEVGTATSVAEVSPNILSSILAKRKPNDGVGVSGCTKSRASFSLCALRQAAGLTPDSGRPSSFPDLPPALSAV